MATTHPVDDPFVELTDAQLYFELKTIQADVHPVLAATRKRHALEFAEIKMTLLFALDVKRGMETSEQQHVQNRIAAAREALHDGSEAHSVALNATLDAFEKQEINELASTQFEYRSHREAATRTLLEVIQHAKELEYAETRDLLETKVRLEMSLRELAAARMKVADLDAKKKYSEVVKTQVKEQVHRRAKEQKHKGRSVAHSGTKS